jgi:hypothetical protein
MFFFQKRKITPDLRQIKMKEEKTKKLNKESEK